MDYYVFCRSAGELSGAAGWQFKMAFPNQDEADAFVSRSQEAGGVEFLVVRAISEYQARANIHLDLSEE